MKSNKDLWIEAGEALREDFAEREGREMTDKEFAEFITDYFSDYLGSLADRTHDLEQDRRMSQAEIERDRKHDLAKDKGEL